MPTSTVTTPPGQSEVSRFRQLADALECGNRYDDEFHAGNFTERVKLLSYLDERCRALAARRKSEDSSSARAALVSARRQVEQIQDMNRRARDAHDVNEKQRLDSLLKYR